MRLRCLNPDHQAYPDYGGRGITVCDRWIDSVENFIADMGPKPGPGYELDRKNNDGPYSPENCRWTTRSRNDRNRRSTRMVTVNGEEVCLLDLCEQHGVRADTVRWRLRKGWTLEEALNTPARNKAPNRTKERVESSGVPYATAKRRIRQGWTPEQAVITPKRYKRETPKRLRPKKREWDAQGRNGKPNLVAVKALVEANLPEMCMQYSEAVSSD